MVTGQHISRPLGNLKDASSAGTNFGTSRSFFLRLSTLSPHCKPLCNILATSALLTFGHIICLDLSTFIRSLLQIIVESLPNLYLHHDLNLETNDLYRTIIFEVGFPRTHCHDHFSVDHLHLPFY